MSRSTLAACAAAVTAAAAVSVAWAATSTVIIGTKGNDHLVGTKGKDVIKGGPGGDTISGLAGNDTLSGGPGNDRLIGGPGADKLDCGPGTDTVVSDAKDRIAADCELGIPRPALSVGDATVTEGNSGTAMLSFPVTLSRASAKAVSVSYATSDGTATLGTDYLDANGTATLAPGTTSTTIAVTVNGDTEIEPDETVNLALFNPVNATIGGSLSAAAIGTITNDDKYPHAGHYAGQTSAGTPFSFDVTADGAVTNVSFSIHVPPCTSDLTITVAGPFLIAPDRTLSFTFSGRSSPNVFTGTINASFDAADAVTGTVSVFDAVGSTICTSGTLTWKVA